jgi:hypothetical protein
MDILSALKGQASKLQQQLDTVNAAIKVRGGKNSAAHHRKRRVSASARAKMSMAQKVGEAQSHEQECLDQASPIHDNGIRVLVASWWRKQRSASTTS